MAIEREGKQFPAAVSPLEQGAVGAGVVEVACLGGDELSVEFPRAGAHVASVPLTHAGLDAAIPVTPARTSIDAAGLGELVDVEVGVVVAQDLCGHPHDVGADGVRFSAGEFAVVVVVVAGAVVACAVTPVGRVLPVVIVDLAGEVARELTESHSVRR